MGAGAEDSQTDYDKVSRVYDTGRMANAELVEKLVRLLHISKGSIVLDLGCGTGNYTVTLQRTAKTVVGVDLSAGMLDRARSKSHDLTLARGDIARLPFACDAFDGAFAIQVLHHIREKRRFLCEANRVLRKGASLAIDSCSHRQMRAFWLYRYFPRGLGLDLARIPDTEEIASLMRRAGFSGIGMEVSYTDIAAEHDKPEHYLDKSYRDGQSTFQLLSENEIDQGCRRLKEDIASGAAVCFIRQCEEQEEKVGGSCVVFGRKVS